VPGRELVVVVAASSSPSTAFDLSVASRTLAPMKRCAAANWHKIQPKFSRSEIHDWKMHAVGQCSSGFSQPCFFARCFQSCLCVQSRVFSVIFSRSFAQQLSADVTLSSFFTIFSTYFPFAVITATFWSRPDSVVNRRLKYEIRSPNFAVYRSFVII